MDSTEKTAVLSSKEGYTIFRFGTHIIRFKPPYSLERYSKINQWDRGYLVVMAKYSHKKDDEEEYIDLVPILDDLYFDTEKVLDSIIDVRIEYD